MPTRGLTQQILLLLLLIVPQTGTAQAHHAVATPSGVSKPGLVVVDPGHGGKDPGTVGGTGDKEKDIVLAVGCRLAECLTGQGLKTAMTRPTDHFVALDARPALANRRGAALLVSIHANSNRDHRVHGFTVYIAPHGSQRTRAIAHAIEQSLAAEGFPSLGIQTRPFRVLVNSRVPAILIELGFLSNAEENVQLCDVPVRGRYAQAISRGIIQGLSR